MRPFPHWAIYSVYTVTIPLFKVPNWDAEETNIKGYFERICKKSQLGLQGYGGEMELAVSRKTQRERTTQRRGGDGGSREGQSREVERPQKRKKP